MGSERERTDRIHEHATDEEGVRVEAPVVIKVFERRVLIHFHGHEAVKKVTCNQKSSNTECSYIVMATSLYIYKKARV